MSKKTNTKTKADKKQEKALIAPNSIITLTIPAKKASEEYHRVLKRLSKNVKTAGFRKGRVPKKIAEEIIGQSKLINKTLQSLLPDLYTNAIKKDKKKPLSQPKFRPIQIKIGEDWKIEAHFAEAPEIDLKNFKKIIKTAKKQAEKHIKEAEAQIKKQSKKANKKTDSKAQFKTAQKLTDTQKKDSILQFIFKELITEIKPSIPQLLVEEETQRELEKLVNNLSRMKLRLEDYLKSQKLSFEQLSQQLTASSLGKLQLDFILNKITLEEKISATKEDIKKYLEKIQDKILREKMKKNASYQSYLKYIVKRQKTMDHLFKL
ncbi:MAG: trigger factor [Candidatus Woesebacteria bacterium]|jgi:FKBP-type peptidyl-prolyl cis-trans isomerase (trigger factor)